MHPPRSLIALLCAWTSAGSVVICIVFLVVGWDEITDDLTVSRPGMHADSGIERVGREVGGKPIVKVKWGLWCCQSFKALPYGE